jgi:hypothetical protein
VKVLSEFVQVLFVCVDVFMFVTNTQKKLRKPKKYIHTYSLSHSLTHTYENPRHSRYFLFPTGVAYILSFTHTHTLFTKMYFTHTHTHTHTHHSPTCILSSQVLQALVDKYVGKILEFKKNNVSEMLRLSPLACVVSLTKLFDAVATKSNGVIPGTESFNKLMDMWFTYSVAWSLGAGADEAGRKRLDAYIREIDAQLPGKMTVYDYYVDHQR